MPKTIRNQFITYLTFIKLYEAHKRARKNKVSRAEIILFEHNLENNLMNLLNSIKDGNYSVSKYKLFTVYEPKERQIQSLPYIDRIVHQWYINEFIKPYILPRLIYTTYACIDFRGTHLAVLQVQKNMRKYARNISKDYYILKCDIKKYFMSINKDILFNILKRYIKDKKLLNLTYIILFDNAKENKGIPIGNYTSQYFANIYLNELDQYVLHTLKNSTYVRYMDDFVMLVKDKETAKEIKKQIENFLKDNLKLELNHKSRYYPSKMGVNFCGYRIFETHKLLRTNSKKKIKKNVRKWNNKYFKKRLNSEDVVASLNSWFGHAKHSNSYTLKKNILNKCKFLEDNKNKKGLSSEIINLWIEVKNE